MPQYLALLYDTEEGDWSKPEDMPEDAEPLKQLMAEYDEFDRIAGDAVKGGAALYPSSTATTVRVRGGKGGDVVTSDGPFAETKEVLGGYYLLEAPDLDAAIALAARIPAAWTGSVEIRPVMDTEALLAQG
jgi:hypothetical protein